MLEGKTEKAVLAMGQVFADFFAFRRVNGELWRHSLNYIRQNFIGTTEVLRAIFDAIRYTIASEKRLSGLASFFFYRLTFRTLPKGFVSEPVYWRTLHRAWGGISRNVSDVKTLTRRLIDSDDLPDLGYYINQNWFDQNYVRTSLSEFLQTLGSQEVVIKRDYSERSNHVLVMTASELEEFNSKLFGNFVVQRKIYQHSTLDQLANGRQVTLRILTVFPQGAESPTAISALIKFDDAEGASNQMRMPVNARTGKYLGYCIDRYWKRTPINEPNLDLDGEVPGFFEAKRRVLEIHRRFPHFQLIGWDLGIDQDSKPWVYEWNADHPGIIFHQACFGPVLFESGLRTVHGKFQ